MKNTLSFLLALASVQIFNSLWAQGCDERINVTTPESRFTVNAGASSITDLRTGLVWQRCPLGYSIDNKGTDRITDDSCNVNATESEAKFTWSDALKSSVSFNQVNGNEGWRVPNIKELISIVEWKCFSPAINLNLFPDTPSENFWSSSSADVTYSVLFTSFQNGSVRAETQDQAYRVRLVKYTN